MSLSAVRVTTSALFRSTLSAPSSSSRGSSSASRALRSSLFSLQKSSDERPLSPFLLSSAFSSFRGLSPFLVSQKNENAKYGSEQNQRRGVTSMAWGGALAAVRLIVQGKHMELTDSIKEYVEEKVGHGVQNHVPLVREVDVRMSVRGGDVGKGPRLQRCEVTIYTKKHGVVRAEEEAETMYAAIDKVSDVIARKLRKIKEKDGGHGRTWQMKHQPKLGEMLPEEPVDLTPILNKKTSDLPDEVVRTKFFDMAPMTTESALEEMVNIGHDFYAFRNVKTGDINILYKRHHGGYGLIVPKSDSQGNGAADAKKVEPATAS